MFIPNSHYVYFYLAKISFPYSNFNSSQIAEWNGKFMDLDFKNKTFEPVGCDVDKFSWCTSMHPMSPLFFYGCFVVAIGFAFACINVELNTLFSKIIGPRKQGMEQGLLQVTGGSARMTGPVLIRCFRNLTWLQLCTNICALAFSTLNSVRRAFGWCKLFWFRSYCFYGFVAENGWCRWRQATSHKICMPATNTFYLLFD